jgi:hypothetical protein
VTRTKVQILTVSRLPGKKAFRVTEGAAFAIDMQHDAALAGGVFVAKLAPAVPGASVDPAAADLHAEEAGAQLAVPTYHKLLLGTPPSVQLNPSGRGRGIFRTSLFGKPVLELLALLVQKYEYAEAGGAGPIQSPPLFHGAQITCFTSTRVQILTQKLVEQGQYNLLLYFMGLKLLALPVQEYKY